MRHRFISSELRYHKVRKGEKIANEQLYIKTCPEKSFFPPRWLQSETKRCIRRRLQNVKSLRSKEKSDKVKNVFVWKRMIRNWARWNESKERAQQSLHTKGSVGIRNYLTKHQEATSWLISLKTLETSLWDCVAEALPLCLPGICNRKIWYRLNIFLNFRRNKKFIHSFGPNFLATTGFHNKNQNARLYLLNKDPSTKNRFFIHQALAGFRPRPPPNEDKELSISRRVYSFSFTDGEGVVASWIFEGHFKRWIWIYMENIHIKSTSNYRIK